MHSLLRNLRGRDLAEFRTAELLGILTGLNLALGATDFWPYFLGRWLEDHPELHEDPVCKDLRNKLQPHMVHYINTGEALPEPPKVHHITGILEEDLQFAWRTPDVAFSPGIQPQDITFQGKVFVFSGKFDYPREIIESIVLALGGFHAPRITRKTDYLVVGSTCEPTWKHQRRGRKIEQAEKIIHNLQNPKNPKNIKNKQLVKNTKNAIIPPKAKTPAKMLKIVSEKFFQEATILAAKHRV